ncbi:glycoside hydrolase family 3 protein [Phenylobacterium montanum]|uniref:Exo 1,3/1,4-beta-D-glucan glucohydrolase n=1 Tax=Phenylobacterium montanum TaxID=2823693 RepID=A0A975FZC6_9CAUL|nr:exo 1,3/1,4-beta-D-glucan glucohydrolase [Caulobacter sp. S6]QUD88273.1 exo 1,3/1,4-beta-D-glucan glucohydrolase [Caulobacter sp. S6]
MLSRSLLAGLLSTVVAAGPVLAQPAAERGVAHPELWPQAHSTGLVDPRTEAFVSSLMARMTLEEKVGQMIQADTASIVPADLRQYPLGGILAGGNSPPLGAPDRSPAPAWVATARAFRAVSLEARPGHVPIPVIFGIDAVHGNNNVVGAVLFPHNVGLGATHDPELIRQIGQVTAEETAAAGIDWAFGPTLAAPQDDRWGRTYEGYSEYPDIIKAYAPAMVTGLQGAPGTPRGLQHGRVAASIKHFLGDGGTKGGVDQGDDDISEADLIRLHAQGYPPAIDAGAMTVMVSYSSWQGRKMHGNQSLLTGVLKGRMGFEGFVISDWNGHGQVPGCSNVDCPAAFNAGVDMIMAPDGWKGLFDHTVAEVRSGAIPMSRVDDAVRRILRVKAKLGLFEAARPFEGDDSAIASPAHRAVARQAVRESLVLLKNDGVLPIKGSAHVLVAGSGADDIGRQSGGWTLSWQGTGNTKADFPNGQSIWSGIDEAVKAAGGSTELNVDGDFKQKPDMAIVVFGETPYAEFQGDIRTLEYQPGDKTDLALLKKLRAQGIPVVSVFLSGRPLWVNPEINASNAFVAAWLPGSEGAGVADVLVGDAAGHPRNDFRGKLSFSWPRTAAQTSLNWGQQPYDPLFPYGFGLTYADHATLPVLSEVSGVNGSVANTDNYFQSGHTTAPWGFVLTAGAVRDWAGAGGSPADAGGVVSLRPVDAAGIQEGGRQLTWSGKGEGAAALTGPSIDLTRQANGDVSLLLEYRIDRAPTAAVSLRIGQGGLDLTQALAAGRPGEWRQVKVKLACFREAGADLSSVTEPFALATHGGFGVSLRAVKLSTDPTGAVCLPKARGGA